LIRCKLAPMENGKAVGMREVDPARWKLMGVIADPPNYQDGTFNTQYCKQTLTESAVYQAKAQRPGVPMREVVQYLMKMKGF